MKYNIFDVVELKNGDRATILIKLKNNKYRVEIVNVYGISKGIREIYKYEIKQRISIHKK